MTTGTLGAGRASKNELRHLAEAACSAGQNSAAANALVEALTPQAVLKLLDDVDASHNAAIAHHKAFLQLAGPLAKIAFDAGDQVAPEGIDERLKWIEQVATERNALRAHVASGTLFPFEPTAEMIDELGGASQIYRRLCELAKQREVPTVEPLHERESAGIQ